MSIATPGPAADLIEHAAGIIVEARKRPYTAPGHWAGALWKAGMLVAPGSAQFSIDDGAKLTAFADALQANAGLCDMAGIAYLRSLAARMQGEHSKHAWDCDVLNGDGIFCSPHCPRYPPRLPGPIHRGERMSEPTRPEPTGERSENPYCMRCGKHLAKPFHETNEHDEAAGGPYTEQETTK